MSVLPVATPLLETEYELLGELGVGTYGVVRECRRKTDGADAACKSVDKRKLTRSQLTLLQNEVLVMCALRDCPSVVTLHGVYENTTHLHLVMESCRQGDLYEYMHRKWPLTECHVAGIFFQLCVAVRECHMQQIIHRDIKPENVFLACPLPERTSQNVLSPHNTLQSNKSPGFAHHHPLTKSLDYLEMPAVRLGDFGLACHLKPGQSLSSNCGSTFYIAPEVILGCYSYPSDIWALGVLLYVMLGGGVPFKGESHVELLDDMLRGGLAFPPERWEGRSRAAIEVIRAMLSIDPARRPTIEQLLESDWLREYSLFRPPVDRPQEMPMIEVEVDLMLISKSEADSPSSHCHTGMTSTHSCHHQVERRGFCC